MLFRSQQATADRGLSTRLVFDALPVENDGRGSLHEEVSLRGRGISGGVATDAAFAVEPDADEST